MPAKVYLDDGDVQITSQTFAVSGQTIPIDSVQKVQQSKEEQLGCLPHVVVGVGAILALAGLAQGLESATLGIVVIAAGVIWYRRLKPKHYLLLSTSGGMMRVLDTKDWDRISRVRRALDKALVDEEADGDE